VNRIDVHQRRGSHFESLKTIDRPDRISAIVAQVNRLRQGWDPVRVSVPAGRLRVVFRENGDDAKRPLFCIAVCPRKHGGEIVADIGDTSCARDVSEAELDQLLAVLGIERRALDEVPPAGPVNAGK
jgi:hypothetical protein